MPRCKRATARPKVNKFCATTLRLTLLAKPFEFVLPLPAHRNHAEIAALKLMTSRRIPTRQRQEGLHKMPNKGKL